MAKTDVSAVVKHFPSAQDGYTSTLSSTVIAPAATVPINGGLAGYDDGDVVVFVVDPGSATKEQVVTGTVDTAGSQLTGAKWLRGTNTTHTAGATVVDYWEAAHVKMFTKGLLAAGLTQAGGMGAISPTSVTSTGTITANSFVQTGSGSTAGWSVGVNAPDTVTALGNRSYSMVFNSTDYSTTLSAGMRLRTTRTVAAPTRCTSLNGTTQYYSKSSPTGAAQTDDITAFAWVKPTAYQGTHIIGRSSTLGTNGWRMYSNSDGTVSINGGSRFSSTYQSLPLNKWTHVAFTIDMSAGTTTAYFDGVSVPVSALSSAGTSWTAAGNIEVGSAASGTGNFWKGGLGQVGFASKVMSQSEVQSIISQGITSALVSSLSIVSAYSFDNSINDLNTTNANNLTANGSAVATSADSPFGNQADGTISSTLDYAIIQKVAFSTNTTVTVQVPEGCTIPTSGGVSSVVYSSNKAPYGFPASRGKWSVQSYMLSSAGITGGTSGTWYNASSFQANIPIGEWNVRYSQLPAASGTGATDINLYSTLSTSTSAETDKRFLRGTYTTLINNNMASLHTAEDTLSLSAATPYYALMRFTTSTATTSSAVRHDLSTGVISAENAYL